MYQLEGNPAPNPTVWHWDPDPKVTLQPQPPIFLKIVTLSHPTPIFSQPCHKILAHAIIFAPATASHQPHPLPILANKSLDQSQKTLISPPPHL